MKNIRKIIAFSLIFALFGQILPIFAESSTDNAVKIGNISAESACLIESESQKILYSKNDSKRMPMASTTKIMTAIVAIESGLPLDTVVKIPKEAVGVEGSSVYLRENEEMTFEALLYSLLLSSANDAAVAISYAVSGSVDSFVSLMNSKASSLGLTNTNFTNPHGLYDEHHYTTSSELAVIMAYAMKNSVFAEISACSKKTFPKDDTGVRVLINHNRLLKTYEGVIGGKTGFTKKSGRCLVSCAERDGMQLICVTLNASNDWNDHKTLYDFAFASYKRVYIDKISLDIPVISGKSPSVTASTENDVSFLISKSQENIEVRIEAPVFAYAEIKKGDIMGRVVYSLNGIVLTSLPLVANENVAKIRYGFNFFEWLRELFKI